MGIEGCQWWVQTWLPLSIGQNSEFYEDRIMMHIPLNLSNNTGNVHLPKVKEVLEL